MQAIEDGRRHRIAAEVWNKVLDERRDDILRDFENGVLTVDNGRDATAELRIMKRFKDMAAKMIALGELAQERLNEIDN